MNVCPIHRVAHHRPSHAAPNSDIYCTTFKDVIRAVGVQASNGSWPGGAAAARVWLAEGNNPLYDLPARKWNTLGFRVNTVHWYLTMQYDLAKPGVCSRITDGKCYRGLAIVHYSFPDYAACKNFEDRVLARLTLAGARPVPSPEAPKRPREWFRPELLDYIREIAMEEFA